MSRTPKKKEAPPSVTEHVTEFEVDSGGTLSMLGHYQPETRAEFYEDVAGYWSGSPQALADAMDECQPLAWAVHSVYSEFRDELSSDVQEAQKAGTGHKKRLAALQARLRTMPEEPEDGVEAWLLALTTREFEEWVSPEIEKWFESPPDWAFEDDYLPESGTAQGAALAFFRTIEGDSLDLLGVQIVEGDRPGSSYFAAELVQEINIANSVAIEHRIPVRFVHRQSTECKRDAPGKLVQTPLPLHNVGASKTLVPADALKVILNAEVAAGSFSEHHELPDGSTVAYTTSQAAGLAALQAVNRYRAKFGELPDWVVICHPTHRRRVCDWALLNDTPLPALAPGRAT